MEPDPDDRPRLRNRADFDAEAAWTRCRDYRLRILEISQRVSALHVAPAFSCVEMVDAIYHHLMRWQPGATVSPDVFVMSKGHGCMIQYVILAEMDILSAEDIEQYCRPGGRLGAHPDYGVPGIAASTGSLGHGMGLSVGMAYAERLQRRDGRVFLVLSDGECQEGSTWEAAMMAGNLKLGNLTAFVDMNDFTGLERLSVGHPAFQPLDDKFRAFGWEAAVVDGHDGGAVLDAVDAAAGGKPLVVIGRTTKGKGVSYMENQPIWHYRSPSPEEYRQALTELLGADR